MASTAAASNSKLSIETFTRSCPHPPGSPVFVVFFEVDEGIQLTVARRNEHGETAPVSYNDADGIVWLLKGMLCCTVDSSSTIEVYTGYLDVSDLASSTPIFTRTYSDDGMNHHTITINRHSPAP